MIILTCICDIMQILRYFIKMYGFIKKIMYGFFKIRTMYGQYIPYNPYIVATLNIRKLYFFNSGKWQKNGVIWQFHRRFLQY